MSCVDATSGPRRISWRRLLVGVAALAAALGLKAASEALHRYRFAFNETESLPYWAFLADQADRVPQRGELVVFLPPKTRFYPQGMAFGKIVGGVPGDLVEARGRSFYVAGRYIGEAKTHSQDGRPAPMGPVGRIPPGRYFLYTPHRDSLDSRYSMIGWVPQRQILGVAKGIM